MNDNAIQQHRSFLKDTLRKTIDFRRTDQSRGLPPPPLEKPVAPEARRIDLVPPAKWTEITDIGLITAMANRRSQRRFTAQPFTLEELSFLLWATQGVQHVLSPGTALRTVPSAGCRHAFETYLVVLNVGDLETGIYRYLPVEHQLVLEFTEQHVNKKLVAATFGQTFIGSAPVTFVWTVIPYRMEWRYGLAAHRVIAIDAGHVCQNLYLACSAVRAGTCAIAAYDQERMDELLRVDGADEFTLYLAPVGKI